MFIEIAVDPGFDFSWPKGLAWDRETGTVVVMTSHVYTRFFGYDPDRSAWEWMPTDIRDLPLEPAIPIGAGDVEHLQLDASSGKSCRPSRSHRERTLARGR